MYKHNACQLSFRALLKCLILTVSIALLLNITFIIIRVYKIFFKAFLDGVNVEISFFAWNCPFDFILYNRNRY